MAELSLEGLTKIYPNGFKAVDELNIDIADGEFLVLVGPSGCGKSTALRMVAGLEEITSGNLSINGDLMNDVEPKDRNIARFSKITLSTLTSMLKKISVLHLNFLVYQSKKLIPKFQKPQKFSNLNR